MYLYWFERIVRKMANDPCWALPYWNWSSSTERRLPAPFRDPSSVLYTANRDAAMNDGTGSLPPFDVDYGTAFAITDFTNASSSLEGTPHGAVHVDIGGWMGSVPTAAQDPIFYLHHCNIDRLWNLWLAQGGGRVDPLPDAAWRNTQFTFFDENGQAVKMTGCEVVRAAQQLGYAYEGEPAQVNEYCGRVLKFPVAILRTLLLQLPNPPVVLGPKPVTVTIDVRALSARITTAMRLPTQTLLFELEDVTADRQPGVVWEVYVGARAEGLKRDSTNATYVGNIALFGNGIRSESHHGFKPAHFAFPIERALAVALRQQRGLIPVTFIPHGLDILGKASTPEVASAVRVGKMSLTVETAK